MSIVTGVPPEFTLAMALISTIAILISSILREDWKRMPPMMRLFVVLATCLVPIQMSVMLGFIEDKRNLIGLALILEITLLVAFRDTILQLLKEEKGNKPEQPAAAAALPTPAPVASQT